MPCHEQSGTEASGSKSSGMPAPLTENGNGNGNGNDASRNLKIASIINGSASSSGSGSGSGPDQAPSPTDSVAQSRGFEGADRTEVTRIMIQALENLGYQQVANELAQQSGCRLETPAVSALRSSILDGAWDKTEAMLKVAVAGPQDSNTQPELCLRDGVNIKEIIYLVRQQKFFELLQEQQSFKALNALRNELNPLVRNDDNELKFLTSLLMCVSPEAVRKRGNLPDTIEEARQNLLNKISKCISPQVMLPEKRLENIFKEVRLIQQKVCTRHTCPVTMSLLEDHQCNPANFPSKPAIDLADLDGNEVWQVRFSDCGSKLAASDDKGNLAIWETECFTLLHKIEVHSKGITNFAWSPDGTKIVTCSSARNAVLIDATVGEVLKEAASFAAECTSCAWTPDGRFFWLSTLDETKNLGLYSATGDLVREMNQTFRVLDMCLSPDGGHIVLVCQQWWIYVLDAETGETKAKYRPSFNPISITMGRDPNTLLANAKSGELVLLDVMTGNAKHKLLGPGECGAVIRGSIGGADESYIVSGSDSGNLYIWHAFNGSNVESIKAQPLRTNSACFNPADPTMIASCSDDGLVKIWTGTDKADVLYNKHHSARPPNGFSNGSRHMHLNSQRSHPSWDDSDGR